MESWIRVREKEVRTSSTKQERGHVGAAGSRAGGRQACSRGGPEPRRCQGAAGAGEQESTPGGKQESRVETARRGAEAQPRRRWCPALTVGGRRPAVGRGSPGWETGSRLASGGAYVG